MRTDALKTQKVMKIKNICLAGALAAGLLAGCKEEPYLWESADYVRIEGPEEWTQGTDSMMFTFSIYPEEMTEFTVEAVLFVQGRVADHDRTIRLSVDESRTTARAEDYEMPEEVVMKAGEYRADFEILLRRSPELADTTVRLQVGIDPSSALQHGVQSESGLTIAWNDEITEPANWADLEEFFGSYSDTKYRFIISTLGIATFPYGVEEDFTWGRMWNYRLTMIEALEAYNNDPSNPDRPMSDKETGELISFEN